MVLFVHIKMRQRTLHSPIFFFSFPVLSSFFAPTFMHSNSIYDFILFVCFVLYFLLLIFLHRMQEKREKTITWPPDVPSNCNHSVILISQETEQERKSIYSTTSELPKQQSLGIRLLYRKHSQTYFFPKPYSV